MLKLVGLSLSPARLASQEFEPSALHLLDGKDILHAWSASGLYGAKWLVSALLHYGFRVAVANVQLISCCLNLFTVANPANEFYFPLWVYPLVALTILNHFGDKLYDSKTLSL